MDENAQAYNRQGLRLAQSGKYDEAIDFFTRAIEIDPFFPDPYHNRGQILLLQECFVEGNTDVQKAKDLRSGKLRKKIPERIKSKITIGDYESIYDAVFPDKTGETASGSMDFDDSFYNKVFTDDVIESETTWDAIFQPAEKKENFPAILEFLGGKRLEVARAVPFSPTPNDISIIRQDGYVERVIPLEKLTCIRIADLPSINVVKEKGSCQVEIIETVDGNIFHEAIHPDQDMENILLGFSTKEQSTFAFSLIPRINIKKRCQKRHLGDILLEKNFIADDKLKDALDQHQQMKCMKLGRILAQNTQVDYTYIEEELEKAKKRKMQGLKTGEILLFSGLVNEEQVLEALDCQQTMQKIKIGEFLIEKGVIREKDLYIALAEKFRIPFVDLKKQKVSRTLLTFLPRDIILLNEILPLSYDKDILKVASHRPDVSATLRETIRQTCNCLDVQFVLAQPTHLKNVINLLFRKVKLGG